MQRTLPLLILAVIVMAATGLWLWKAIEDWTPTERPTGRQPGEILGREELVLQDETASTGAAPRTQFAPWEVLLPGLPFPPPTIDDSLLWPSELEVHFPYLPEPTWSLLVVEEETGFTLPHALVLIGPRGLLAWQQREFPEGNLEGLLMRNGVAFRTDDRGRLRIPPSWIGLPVGVRHGDAWGSGVLAPPLQGRTLLLHVAEDKGILVRTQGPEGAVEGVEVGLFVSSHGTVELVRRGKTDANGFAWLLHATDPGIRRRGPATWWVGLLEDQILPPETTHAFDLLPLRAVLRPKADPASKTEDVPFYPLGVNRLEDTDD